MSSLSIMAAIKGYLLRSEPKQAPFKRSGPPFERCDPPFKRCGPPFLALYTFPSEIILQIADYLDGASLLALHHTNRDLFYVISLKPHHFSLIREARYLAAFLRLTNGASKSRMGFCTSCQELRPLTSFPLSEVMAFERLQQASCLRHSRLWMCPHVSYEYESITELPPRGKGFCRIDKQDGYPDCGSTRCKNDFHHRIFNSPTRPSQRYLVSKLFISGVRNRGGPGTLRDKVQSSFPRARLQKAIDNFPAPICDHHLLSDEQVRNKYDPTDIDLLDYSRDSNHDSVILEHERTVRKSDGFCSFCHARGVQTKFRFAITFIRDSTPPGSGSGSGYFRLQAVLIRSLGACPAERNKPDEHWRCHGSMQKKLAQFRDTWTPSDKIYAKFRDEQTLEAQNAWSPPRPDIVP